jgi:hypothetical protein
MKTLLMCVPAVIFLQSNGCDQKPAPVPPPKHYLTRPAHRFESVSSIGNVGVALDTMTGRWCRTWDWQYVAKPDANGLNMLPICYDLFIADPTEIEVLTEVHPAVAR